MYNIEQSTGYQTDTKMTDNNLEVLIMTDAVLEIDHAGRNESIWLENVARAVPTI